ncbi:hypothetical protein SARC_06974 [Sphaeroforma arctica JP610]|uniref:Uncharacterized protein n=1 Tax=Sphaeroforma arctica JP610 TaxID=667725 RepID=A0A0L0FUY9_9EUKA|nr:hypothetical protein SARC_06974 [Sphaeroforma arctica JP610]KNC80660.1 hypothetical protein SARC_06974 [Sphaeroforma arctica JP610]|eukprot:XP_014154562.1 hypothetical protein SARC_06974 [Sphaeroforma arctica JP610]
MDTTKLLMKARAMHYILPNGTSGILSFSSSKVQELSEYMGYRLKVTAASKNADGYTRLTVSKVGIAPTLYDLNVVHKGVTFEPTLRNLKPGASRYVYGKIIVGDNTQFQAEGQYAGSVSQAANSVILNASGADLNATTEGLFASPLRNLNLGTNVLYYGTTPAETKVVELGTCVSDYLRWNGSKWVSGGDKVVIACGAGANDQAQGAVAVGCNAGNLSQGQFGIAIGDSADFSSQAANSVILNASVNPIRNEHRADQMLYYDTKTREVVYSDKPVQGRQVAFRTCVEVFAAHIGNVRDLGEHVDAHGTFGISVPQDEQVPRGSRRQERRHDSEH